MSMDPNIIEDVVLKLISLKSEIKNLNYPSREKELALIKFDELKSLLITIYYTGGSDDKEEAACYQ